MAFRRIHAECLRCHVPLERRAGNGHQHHGCPECEAAFVSTADLAMMFAQAQPRRTLELAIHNDGSPRHACPICHSLMEITWIEFLRAESCTEHGVWFEPGVLAMLLAYDVLPSGLPVFGKPKRKL